MTLVCLGLVLLVAAATPSDPKLDLVIARADGTHATAELPLSDSDLRDVKHLWAWTERLPPRRFDAPMVTASREKLLAQLGRSPTRSVEVVVRGWSRPEELESVRVVAAPREMWGSVPEPLLPTYGVSSEGRVTIPVGEPVRIRVIGRNLGTTWEQPLTSAKSVEIELRAAGDAELILEGSDGTRAPRAFATLMNTRRGDPAPVLQAQFASDARGRVRIPALPDSEIVTLVITAEGAAPRTITGAVAELTRTVRLAAAANIGGRFVDEDGEPIAAVHVEAEGWISPDVPALSGHRVVSDDAGLWTISGLPRARVVVRASTEGRASFRREESLEDGDVDLGTISLPPSMAVTLEVVDPEERPIARALVTSDLGFKGETKDDGTIVVSRMAGDQAAALTVSAERFVKRTVHLAPPLPERDRVILDRGFTIGGRLTQTGGAPAVDASAILSIGSRYSRHTTGSSGEFSFDVDAGQDFELTFESPSTASVTRKENAGRPGELRDLGTIELPAGLVVRGRVVDSAGAPVRDARVWGLRPSRSGAVTAWSGGRIVQATSDAEGSFDLRGLAAGPMLLRIDAADYARAYRSIDMKAEPHDLGAIEVVRGSTVILKARNDDAIARLDLRGEWLDADMITAPVISGEARLRNVPPGRYRITVVHGRAVVCERSVDVAEGDASVECPPPMIVRGRVLLNDTPAYGGSLAWSQPAKTDALINTRTSPLGAMQQNVFGASHGTIVVDVRPDGTFETDQLRAGDWQVAWRSTDSAGTPDRPVSIPDVAEARVIVKFEGGVIRGRVLDARRQPVAGARVREIQGRLFAMAAPDGSFTITGASPGKHRLQAALDARASRILDVEVESGKQTPEVLFEIEDVERNVLIVRVAGTDGNPRPNAFVFVEGLDGIRILTADAHGIARGAFPAGLPEGARIIAFADNAWAFEQLRRSGDEGDPQNMSIRFASTGALRIRSRTSSGAPTVFSQRTGDLTWMLARVGYPVAVTPDVPLVIHGLPPGLYDVRLASSAVTASVSVGSTVTADLP